MQGTFTNVAPRSFNGHLPTREFVSSFEGISLAIAGISAVEISDISRTERLYTQFDQRIVRHYESSGFDTRPKTREEADIAGIKGFNGLQTLCQELTIDNSGTEGAAVKISLVPSRYLIGESYRALVRNGAITSDELIGVAPQYLNISAIAIVKNEHGDYGLLAQIKGKALGEAELHPALIAGGVEAKYLSESDPLKAALLAQAKEETGLSKMQLAATSPFALVRESALGFVNFVSCAVNPDFNSILHIFEDAMAKRLSSGADYSTLEAKGVALLPVAGLMFVPLEGGRAGFSNAKCFVLNPAGKIESRFEPRLVRPMFGPIADLLSNESYLRRVLEVSGW